MFDKKEENFIKFYNIMLVELNRILKDDGILIVLMGNILDFEKALDDVNLFKTDKVFKILVNGKKANIYVLSKFK